MTSGQKKNVEEIKYMASIQLVPNDRVGSDKHYERITC